MEKEITITSKENYYKGMIKLVNCFLGMTDFEIDIIVRMFMNDIKCLNKNGRSLIRSSLNTSEHNFNNYIKKLKDKKVLRQTEEGLIVHPVIVQAVEDKEINIKFNVN